jgi:hypothetical protein
MKGYLVEDDGRFAGTRIVGDANGVEVELACGSQIIARTTIVGGVYCFDGIAPEAYVARTRVIGDIGDRTGFLTVTYSDLTSADTLRLEPRGDLSPTPNPVLESTWISFDVPDTQDSDVRILGLAGGTVRILLALEVLPARHRVLWDGRDQAGAPTGPGMYCVTFVSGLDVRAQLLFR